MALVPCQQCSQPFYASCHDASCIDALCPYCAYDEPATHALPVEPRRPIRGAPEATIALPSTVASRDRGHAHHPALPSYRRQR